MESLSCMDHSDLLLVLPPLLHNETLQLPVIIQLCDRIAAFTDEIKNEAELREILQLLCLHCCPKVQIVRELTKAMFSVEKWIVTILMDIIPHFVYEESAQAFVLKAYRSLLADDRSYVMAILTSLSHINISNKLQPQIFKMARDALRVVEESAYPAIVRTLLRTVTKKTGHDLVRTIRHESANLHLPMTGVLVNVILEDARVNTRSIDFFINVMLQSSELNLLETVLLICLLGHKRKAERAWSTLCLLVKKGSLNFQMVQFLFTTGIHVLATHSESVLTLFSALLTSSAGTSSAGTSSAGLKLPIRWTWLRELLPLAFDYFRDRQLDIVRLLLASVRCDSSLVDSDEPHQIELTEQNSLASHLVQTLCQVHMQSMVTFAPFLEEMIQYPKYLHPVVLHRMAVAVVSLCPVAIGMQNALVLYTQKMLLSTNRVGNYAGVVIASHFLKQSTLSSNARVESPMLSWVRQLLPTGPQALETMEVCLLHMQGGKLQGARESVAVLTAALDLLCGLASQLSPETVAELYAKHAAPMALHFGLLEAKDKGRRQKRSAASDALVYYELPAPVGDEDVRPISHVLDVLGYMQKEKDQAGFHNWVRHRSRLEATLKAAIWRCFLTLNTRLYELVQAGAPRLGDFEVDLHSVSYWTRCGFHLQAFPDLTAVTAVDKKTVFVLLDFGWIVHDAYVLSVTTANFAFCRGCSPTTLLDRVVATLELFDILQGCIALLEPKKHWSDSGITTLCKIDSIIKLDCGLVIQCLFSPSLSLAEAPIPSQSNPIRSAPLSLPKSERLGTVPSPDNREWDFYVRLFVIHRMLGFIIQQLQHINCENLDLVCGPPSLYSHSSTSHPPQAAPALGSLILHKLLLSDPRYMKVLWANSGRLHLLSESHWRQHPSSSDYACSHQDRLVLLQDTPVPSWISTFSRSLATVAFNQGDSNTWDILVMTCCFHFHLIELLHRAGSSGATSIATLVGDWTGGWPASLDTLRHQVKRAHDASVGMCAMSLCVALSHAASGPRVKRAAMVGRLALDALLDAYSVARAESLDGLNKTGIWLAASSDDVQPTSFMGLDSALDATLRNLSLRIRKTVITLINKKLDSSNVQIQRLFWHALCNCSEEVPLFLEFVTVCIDEFMSPRKLESHLRADSTRMPAFARGCHPLLRTLTQSSASLFYELLMPCVLLLLCRCKLTLGDPKAGGTPFAALHRAIVQASHLLRLYLEADRTMVDSTPDAPPPGYARARAVEHKASVSSENKKRKVETSASAGNIKLSSGPIASGTKAKRRIVPTNITDSQATLEARKSASAASNPAKVVISFTSATSSRSAETPRAPVAPSLSQSVVQSLSRPVKALKVSKARASPVQAAPAVPLTAPALPVDAYSLREADSNPFESQSMVLRSVIRVCCEIFPIVQRKISGCISITTSPQSGSTEPVSTQAALAAVLTGCGTLVNLAKRVIGVLKKKRYRASSLPTLVKRMEYFKDFIADMCRTYHLSDPGQNYTYHSLYLPPLRSAQHLQTVLQSLQESSSEQIREGEPDRTGTDPDQDRHRLDDNHPDSEYLTISSLLCTA